MSSVQTSIDRTQLPITAAVRKEIERIVDARIRKAHVTREDFSELKGIVGELAAAQKRTEQRVEQLALAQARTEEAIKELTGKVSKMDTRLAKHVGWGLERTYRDNAYGYLGHLLRNVQVVSVQEVEADVLQRLSYAEVADLIPLDLLIHGIPRQLPDAPQVWLAMEVSGVVDRHDVERAMQRAALLRKAGYLAIPAVAGEDATEGGELMARYEHVLLLQDGRRQFWDEALTQVLAA